MLPESVTKYPSSCHHGSVKSLENMLKYLPNRQSSFKYPTIVPLNHINYIETIIPNCLIYIISPICTLKRPGGLFLIVQIWLPKIPTSLKQPRPRFVPGLENSRSWTTRSVPNPAGWTTMEDGEAQDGSTFSQ